VDLDRLEYDTIAEWSKRAREALMMPAIRPEDAELIAWLRREVKRLETPPVTGTVAPDVGSA
jgi:hypothetical protein